MLQIVEPGFPSNFGGGWCFHFLFSSTSTRALFSSWHSCTGRAQRTIFWMRIATCFIVSGVFVVFCQGGRFLPNGSGEKYLCRGCIASLSVGSLSPGWRCLLIKLGLLGLIVVLIRHRCGHPDSGKSSKQFWQQTPLRRERGYGSCRDHFNCFWQGSNPNMYTRENESSLKCHRLNWDIYDCGVEGRDGFLLSGMWKWSGKSLGDWGERERFDSLPTANTHVLLSRHALMGYCFFFISVFIIKTNILKN